MKKNIINQIKSVLNETYLNEESINDFFGFLEQDPKKGSFSHVYYTYPIKVNKFIKDAETGEKTPNPMFDKLFKTTQIVFNFEDTYKKGIERWEEKSGEQHVPGERSGDYEKVQGYSVIETGKNGLYFPVLPKNQKTISYSVLDDSGARNEISKEEAIKYIPQRKQYDAPVQYRQLIVDRISKISAGGNTWDNPNFIY